MSYTDQHEKWDMRFLALSEHIATWSKDPSSQVGSVIVRPNRTVCSTGYNGFPRKMPDTTAHYQNREIKYQRVIHAEMNAILTAPEPLTGCAIYIWPIPVCVRCAPHVAQTGITRVVAPEKRWFPDLWDRVDVDEAIKILQLCGIRVSLRAYNHVFKHPNAPKI